jgi:hypothetical protein
MRFFDDPAFWRAGAISTIVVMSVVLIMLTIDSLAAISPGGSLGRRDEVERASQRTDNCAGPTCWKPAARPSRARRA